MSNLDEAFELLQVTNIGGNLLKSHVHWFICWSNVNGSKHQTFNLQLRQAVDLLLHT